MNKIPTVNSTKQVQGLAPLKSWKLEQAKARFSEVVRLARSGKPQRVTVHGEDAVVIMSAGDYAKLLPFSRQPNLRELLSKSPLNKLKLKTKGVRSPVRKVKL